MKIARLIAAAVLLYSAVSSAVVPDPRQRPFATEATGSQEEYTKLIKSAQSIPAYDGSLFGESVNLYSGATEFSITDVSLPGNSAIPVAFGRRFVVESRGGGAFTNRYALGDWDMDVPHISAVFIAGRGWTVDLNDISPGGESTLRCSGPANVNQARPPIYPSSNVQYDLMPEDYWQGASLYMPGQGNQELLLLTNPSVSRPSDGRTYHWVGKGQWFFACIPLRNGAGEGFLARSPQGLTYYFDYQVTLPHPGVVQKYIGPGGLSERLVERSLVRLYPTLITDRFLQASSTPPNNSVSYTWSGDRLQSISSSDDRTLTFEYHSEEHGKLKSVTAPGARKWTYGYITAAQRTTLQTVTLPDNSAWQLHMGAVQWGETYYWDPPQFDGPPCDRMQRLDTTRNIRAADMIHPSGARGDFVFDMLRHGRSSVSSECISNEDPPDNGHNLYPVNFDTLGLKSKTISGIGVNETWEYRYQSVTGCMAGAQCPDRKTVEVVAPDGSRTVNTYGIRFEENEAQLLGVNTYSGNGELLRQVDYEYVSNAEVASYLFPSALGDSPQPRIDAFFAARLRPQKLRQTTQQAATFAWSASAFDRYANPTAIARTSSLGFSRSETLLYHHNTAQWVLGQIASVTESSTGAVMRSNSYDPSTATLTSTSQFGQPATTMTYHDEGNLKTQKVGSNPVTTFTNYKRGIAQNVALADGRAFSVVVNDLGQIASMTDAASYTTEYRYDLGGRLSRIIYPTGDTPSWNDTTLQFAPVAAAEYGLPAGHWKQTIATGNARNETFFDALWRPVMSRSYDTANIAGTERMTQRRYNSQLRESFVSYPKASIASVTTPVDGTTTRYDALDRVSDVIAASELGALTTSTRYFAGFEKRVTNPRSHTTSFLFQAFDEPGEDSPTAINAPLGISTVIARDVFGKPTAITRSGVYNSVNDSATRRYVYDANQRLCKTIEPETGATVQDYDAANNLWWSASGQSLPSTTACNRGNVADSQKVVFSYDGLNRPLSSTFGDGSPTITRTYTADGRLETLTADTSKWTTLYNHRRLPTSETLKIGTTNYGLGYVYSANGHVSEMTYPDGTAVAYAPNALGEATQVGSYATMVRQHPNGALAAFRYGNGINHTTSQNQRGLPRQSADSGVLSDVYAYDENGNVASITDQALDGLFTRTMQYDAVDRLTQASNQGIWTGALNFEYDALDNLRRSTTPFIDWTHQISTTTQRLTGIVNTSGNQPVVSYSYDTRGRISARNDRTFVTDLGNRLTQVNPGIASYRYDGYGRRTTTVKGGATTYQVYSPAGQLVYEATPGGSDLIFKNGFQSSAFAPESTAATTGTKRYIYLGRHLIAEDGSEGRKYLHTDGLGSPVATTGTNASVLDRRYYVPYGYTTTTAQLGPGFTGHVADTETSLIYMQARFYDPYAGRFVGPDPIGTSGSGTNFNRYWYGNNNPYGFVDPDGRCPKTVDSRICIEARTFDSSRSSGSNAKGTPAMDTAVGDQLSTIRTRRGAKDENIGSLNTQADGSLKVQRISGVRRGTSDSKDTASAAPPLNSMAVVHGHVSVSVADDPYGRGDAGSVKILVRPNYAVSQDGRVMVHELENGRYQVRMVIGEMTDAEVIHYEKATEARQEAFYVH